MIKNGIKPILGYRIKGEYFDYILYLKNEKGYKELLNYVSNNSKDEIFNYDSLLKSDNILYVIDATYIRNEHLIFLSDEYHKFKDSSLKIYVGVDFNYYPCEVALYPIIYGTYDIILINKVMYLKEEDKKASLVLESILKNSIYEEGSLIDMGKVLSLNLKTKDKLLKEYSDYKDLLINTSKFIDLIDIKLKFERKYPVYKTRDSIPPYIYLRELSKAGLKKRLSNTSKDKNLYLSRLNYELEIIHNMGFDDYFLVVYDYILYAKKSGIYVGPGRGSSASSLVSYSLGIIDIDPLEYNLYFERFLNPDRKTMPDIDTDFEDTKRDEVIKYCIEKYGIDNVSLVGSFQTLLAKGALREISTILDISELKLKMISKEIKNDENSIEDLLKKRTILNYYNNDSEIKELLDIAKKIEGVPKSIGTHASAVIISPIKIKDYSEVHKTSSGFNQTVYDQKTIEEIGLLKMDFLSLKTLSTIHETVNKIKENRGIDLNINNIPLDDEKTYKFLREKPLTGIFQFETRGMSELLKKIGPSSFKDLCIIIALFRPGSISYSEEFIRRRNKDSKVEYYDPCLKDILSETLGIIIYQEQIMAIVNVYSGLSLKEADILRRAISKKDESLILELKEKFYNGAKERKRNLLVTDKLFKDILKFAEYGFNKSHSVVYAKIAYTTAYLKANFKEEFMATLLEENETSSLIKECSKLNIKMILPDLRYSSYRYVVKNNRIIIPFTIIKGVGKDYAKEIEKIRNTGDISYEKVISRSKATLPRDLIEKLILSGVFDYTKYNKRTMIEALDGLYEFDPTLIKGLNYKIKIQEEYPFDYLKNREFELLGFNSKYHPLSIYKGDILKLSDLSLGLDDVTIIAYFSSLKITKVKSTNESMAQVIIEDEFSSSKAVIFSKTYYKYAHILENNKIYEISGSYKENRGEPQFVIKGLKKIDV